MIPPTYGFIALGLFIVCAVTCFAVQQYMEWRRGRAPALPFIAYMLAAIGIGLLILRRWNSPGIEFYVPFDFETGFLIGGGTLTFLGFGMWLFHRFRVRRRSRGSG